MEWHPPMKAEGIDRAPFGLARETADEAAVQPSSPSIEVASGYLCFRLLGFGRSRTSVTPIRHRAPSLGSSGFVSILAPRRSITDGNSG